MDYQKPRPAPPSAIMEHLRDRFGQFRRKLDPRRWSAWVLGILLIAIPSQLMAVWRVFGDLPPGTRPPMRDSIIFEYIGWHLTQGGRLYVDIWELKPPLPYEVTAGLSLLAGGDPLLAHGANVALTSTAAVGTALVAGLLVSDITDAPAAAFAAGVFLYVVPSYHWRVAFGFKVKYFVALFALLSIYLARKDRWKAAGGVAGAAIGFWQLAAVVPALVAGIAYDRTRWSGVKPVAVGGTAVVAISLVPIVYWGAVEAMVTETLLVPLLIGGDLGSRAPIVLSVKLLGGSLPVVGLGFVGVLVAVWRRPWEARWLVAGTGWFTLQVLLIDMDGGPDLFPLLAFLAVGFGLLIGLESGRQRPVALLVAVLAVTSVVTMGGFGIGSGPLYEPAPLVDDPDLELTAPYGPKERDLLYWRQVEPETCRVFYGTTQYQQVQRTTADSVQRTCGAAAPVLDALSDQWFGTDRARS